MGARVWRAQVGCKYWRLCGREGKAIEPETGKLSHFGDIAWPDWVGVQYCFPAPAMSKLATLVGIDESSGLGGGESLRVTYAGDTLADHQEVGGDVVRYRCVLPGARRLGITSVESSG